MMDSGCETEGQSPAAQDVVVNSAPETGAAGTLKSAGSAHKNRPEWHQNHKVSKRKRSKFQRVNRTFQAEALAFSFGLPRRIDERPSLKVPTSFEHQIWPESAALVSSEDQEQVKAAATRHALPNGHAATSRARETDSNGDNTSIIQGEAPLHLNAEVGGSILPERDAVRSVLLVQSEGGTGEAFKEAVPSLEEGRPETTAIVSQGVSRPKRKSEMQNLPLTLQRLIPVPTREAKRPKLLPVSETREAQFANVPLSPLDIPQTARLPTLASFPRTPVFGFRQHREEQLNREGSEEIL